jgi:hypothetical protein
MGGWPTPRPGHFTPRKETRYPLYRRLCGPQDPFRLVRKISPLPGFDPRTVQAVVSRHNDWAIPTYLMYVQAELWCVCWISIIICSEGTRFKSRDMYKPYCVFRSAGMCCGVSDSEYFGGMFYRFFFRTLLWPMNNTKRWVNRGDACLLCLWELSTP